jgi:RND family efflux transporter MFP subunit
MWQKMGHGRIRLMAITCALIASGVAVFKMTGHPRATGSSLANSTATVAAVRIERENIAREQVFDAEFRPYEEIELHAKVAGFLEWLAVDVGDRVTNGQLLAVLEIPEASDELEHARAVEKRSEAELKKAEAEHEQAHLAYARLAAVDKAQPNLIAQQDIDLAQAKDRAAEAALETARQQIQVAKTDAKKLETMVNYARITAPFDGVITKRFADPGALIHGGGSSSSPLVRLSQNNRLRLVFPVSVSFVPMIKVGDPVEIKVQSLGKTFSAKISRYTRKIETATRTMEVEAEVANSDLVLIPGMYASVSLQLEHRDQTLVVPVEAVSRQKASTVFVIDKNNQIEERTVQLGLETPSKLEVLAGLSENDLVMIGSRTQVKPGQKVEPKMIEAKNLE